MAHFDVHTIESAPEDSKPLLERTKQEYGMIPNLLGVLAEAPAALEAYRTLNAMFTQKTSLTPKEQTVVWLTISVENGCHYCVPAHTGMAKSMQVSYDIIDALRDEKPLPDEKLEALRQFTLRVVRERGEVASEDVRSFFDAGYGRRQALEVILGVSQKVLSNYANAIAETPVDEPFKKFEWSRQA